MRLQVFVSFIFIFLFTAVTAKAQIAFPNFKSTSGLKLVGTTTVVNKKLELTNAGGGLGAAWTKTTVPVQGGFWTGFQWKMSTFGADGFTFSIQNTSNTAIGGGGGGLGMDGVPNALTIEFDTFPNDNEDANHIAVLSNGTDPIHVSTGENVLGTTSNLPQLNDGTLHSAAIRYIPGTLTVFFDGYSVLAVSVDLSTLLNLDNGKAYVGFTAATGGVTQAHDIYSWSFSSGSNESLAIDPAGHFVLYNAPIAGDNCDLEILWYQALKSDGSASGTPVPLTSCEFFKPDVTGIDLLQDGSDYYVSYNKLGLASETYVLKIDSSGNILTTPTLVFDDQKVVAAPGPTALTPSGSALALYSFAKGGTVYRSVISKSPLSLLSRTKVTGLTAGGNSTLQVTQNAGAFFLAFANPDDVYRGFGLTSSGLWSGSKWRLSPRTDGGHDSGSLSADGLVAGSNDFDPTNDQFYAQPLKSNGLPSGNPAVSAKAVKITASDISNALAGGKRFLVYKNSDGQIFVQPIDSKGNKSGAPVEIL